MTQNKQVHIWIELKNNTINFYEYLSERYNIDAIESVPINTNSKIITSLNCSYAFAWKEKASELIIQLISRLGIKQEDLEYYYCYYDKADIKYTPGFVPQLNNILYVGAIEFNTKNEDYIISQEIEKLLYKKDGEQEIIKLIEVKKLPINFILFDSNGPSGRSLLHLALERKNYKFVQLLIEKGIDLNYTPNANLYPHVASALFSCSDIKSLRLLIDAGVNLTTIFKGKNVISYFSCFGDSTFDIINLLLDHGIIPNIGIDAKKKTDFHRDYLNCNHIPLIELYVKYGLNINQKDSSGKTILDYAEISHATEGKKELIQFLYSIGAENGERDLFNAILFFENKKVEQLLIEGSNPNSINERKESPLTIAVENLNIDALKLLVKYGANTSDKKLLAELAKKSYINKGNKEIIEYLLQFIDDGSIILNNNGKNFFITKSIVRKEFDLTKLLIKKGISLTTQDDQGLTPLYRAISGNNIEGVQFILNEIGLAKTDNFDTYPAITYACNYGQVEILKLLMNQKEYEHNNLYLIRKASEAYYKHPQTSKFLVDQISDLSTIDYFSNINSIIKDAISSNDFEMLYLLINKNVKLNQEKISGEVLYHAIVKQNKTALKLLLENGADINSLSPTEVKVSLLEFVKKEEYRELETIIKDYQLEKN